MKVGEYIVEECMFCGNKTKLDILGVYDDDVYIENYNEETDESFDEWVQATTWMMLKCHVCDSISLGTEFVDKNLGSNDLTYFSMVYPEQSFKSYQLPKNVYNAYMAAIKAQHIDGAICLLSLRRTLEIICKEQGETAGNLVSKVKRLADKGVLPEVLREASDLVRDLGNAAAHGDNVKFTSLEIERMIEFTGSIIEYIYILPMKIKKLKDD